MSWALPDAWNISEKDVLMPMISMFHGRAWGTTYIAAMTGAKLVLPGMQCSSAISRN
jgi:fatty-acyl-CoA synthase